MILAATGGSAVMSVQILLSELSFSYDTARHVLREVSLSLSPGWTGVVGENGSGKTTLLRLLAGELDPTSGTLQRIPGQQVIRYCPQRVENLDPSILQMGERWDGFAQRILGSLNLAPERLQDWMFLSPGERKRWQIAAALVDDPDLLLLDEPTNHLDAEARDLLVDQLQRFSGIGVLVSHDRGLLDLLSTGILRFSGTGRVRRYPGGYTGARALWAREEEEDLRVLQDLQKTRRKVKGRLDSARQIHAATGESMRTGKRMKSVRDSDARSAAAKGKAASGERAAGKQVSLLRAELDRAEKAVERIRIEKSVGRSLFFLEDRPSKPVLVHLKEPRVQRGSRDILQELDLVVRRDTRAHLQGPNGSGKTTLMQEIMARCTLPPERVLYLPQELTPEEIRRNGESLKALPDEEKGRLLQIVAALGVPPERLLETEGPSPGEARKLALALGMVRQAWLLLLDEPTNHLDLPSIERLEEALGEYSSALILVSHDERFARALTRISWKIRQGNLHQ